MPGLPGQEEVRPVSIITYPPEWVQRYFESDYLGVDRVVSEGFANLLPLDWATLNKRPPRWKQRFAQPVDFSIGGQGVAFPVPGPGDESSLSSGSRSRHTR